MNLRVCSSHFKALMDVKVLRRNREVRKKSLFERKEKLIWRHLNWSWKYKTRNHKEVRAEYELSMGDRERKEFMLIIS